MSVEVEAPVAAMASSSHLKSALTDEERSQVPPPITEKLERYIEEHFEQYITSRALHETSRSEIGDKIQKLENTILEITSKYEHEKAKRVAAETSSTELEQQVTNLNSALEKAQDKINRLENELASMKRARDLSIDERNDLTRIIQSHDARIERLTASEASLSAQLSAAVAAKCEAVALNNEFQSKEMALEYREKRMDQERVSLNAQIAGLSEEVNRLTSELQTLRLNSTSRIMKVESQLSETLEELNVAKSNITSLTEQKNTLTARTEELTERLREQREIEFKMSENYRKELEAQAKLTDLYKSMRDDDEEKTNELTEGITELQKLLNEATDKYGELETKSKQMEFDYEEAIEKKNAVISSLKAELDNANDLIKAANAQNLDKALGELAPSASVASKLLQSGMSLTQIYSQLVKLTNDLAHEKEENRHLNLTITTILQELEDKAPVLQKQRTAYEEALESNMVFTQQIDSLVMERNELRDECAEATRLANHYNRENIRLKGELADLGRQVCFMLKEVEQSRGGTLANGDHDPSHGTSPTNTTNTSDISGNLLSKELVTFSTIQELQTNNQKLLRMVRELTEKQNEVDRHQSGEMQGKLDAMKNRITELTEAQDRQTKMVNALIRQRDMYKKLYHDFMNGKRTEISPDEESPEGEGENSVPMDTQPTNESLSKSKVETTDVSALEIKLKNAEKQLELLQVEYKTYKEEKTTNERMMIEQIDNTKKEISKLTISNCKSAMTAEYNSDRLKSLQANCNTYKKQIAGLEERNKMLTVTLGKYEESAKLLRDEALNAQSKLVSAEVKLENLKMEVMLLKDAEARLLAERESMSRQQQGQALLLNNLEMIKASMERAEVEGRMRLETRLDDATRECAALRLRLQEEQDRFRELADHLERQTQTAKTRMQEEKDAADTLRTELTQLRQEFTEKCKSHEELAKKLKTALTPDSIDGTFDALKKVKNLESQLESKVQEVVSLQKQISTSEEHIRQYSMISEDAEKNIVMLKAEYDKYKDETQAKLQDYEKKIKYYQERCSELEAELSVQTEGQSSTSLVLKSDVSKLEEDLKCMQANLDTRTAELGSAIEEIRKLSASVELAEEKYSHEVVLHSADIQMLMQVKQEMSLLQQELNEIKLLKDKTLENLESEKTSWLQREKLFTTEIEELKTQLDNVHQQNAVLHDQLQALGTQMSVAEASKSLSDSMNESTAERSCNISIGEDENHSSKQLLQVIKLIRKEKDIAMAKFNILQAETSRLKSELEITHNKLDETTSALEKERTKSEVDLVTVTRQSDILRKVETLNALTDSNRVLREERDGLLQRIEELTVSTKSLQEELAPLQEKIFDLTSKNEGLQTENTSLKADTARWRARVNALVERANKTSPEDWKRLQNERETLAKMLTNEKESVKKLNEEIVSLKTERSRVEEQLSNLSRQHGGLVDDHRRLNEELQTIRHDVNRITDELNKTKTELAQCTENNTKINEEMASKEAALTEIRNKELQIRKIAKKYKVQYEELTKNVEEEKKKTEGAAAETSAAAGDAARKVEARISELESKLNDEQSESQKLKAELERLQAANNDKEEKAKQVLKHAKIKIVQLTEARNNLESELNESRSKMEALEQSNRDEQDVRLAVIKSQYEGRVSRLEKERAEVLAEKAREMEVLTQKVSLLQRQLASQASSSKQQPAAEKSTTEPPTANIKPMAGVAQQSVSGSRRGGETPLASIRPMAQVGPTAPHDAHSTEYMPASSSRPLPRATVAASPASSASTASSASIPPPPPPESTQDMDVSEAGAVTGASDTTTQPSHVQPPQQGVALVMPRIEQAGASGGSSTASITGSTSGSTASVSASTVSGSAGISASASGSVSGSVSGSTAGSVSASTAGSVSASTGGSVSASTAGSVSASTAGSVSASTAASVVAAVSGASIETGAIPQSSNGGGGVSTSHSAPADARAIKRPRPPCRPAHPSAKRTRVQGFERSVDIEYQVPTSSRCDQDDENVIVVDSEEDDDRCTGNLYQEGETYAEEEEEEEEDDMEDEDAEAEGSGDEDDDEEGPADDESADARQMNMEDEDAEAEGSGDEDDDEGAPDDTSANARQESPAQSSEAGEAGEAEERGEAEGRGAGDAGAEEAEAGEAGPAPPHQQIETISSGTEPSGALSLGGAGGGGDEGDDSIVPSTPTLYVPRRNDGFGEAVVSPVGANAARFTFAAAEAGSASHHDTHADLAASLPPPPPPLQPSQRAGGSGGGEEWGEARAADEEAAAVSSQGSQPSSPHQVAEEGREAEASASPTRGVARRRPYLTPSAHSPRNWHHDAESRGGRGGRGRRARRPHNYRY